MPFINEREDDEETQQTLDHLDGCITRVLDRVRMRVTICTHESGWTEETTRPFVDVGEFVGWTIVWGRGW